MLKRVEIGIAGQAFRANSFEWIEGLAQELSIRGAVFTRPDGSIRITAEGEELILREFVRNLEKGSIFGTIENFFINWHQADKTSSFRVLAGC